jgi:hypothetical protein
MLHLRALGQREGILDINAKVADRALNLRMAKQNLHGAQVSRLLVDDRRFRPAVSEAIMVREIGCNKINRLDLAMILENIRLI